MTFPELVAAEVRAELARKQLSGVRTARALGWTQNYISTRLTGKTPFSLADLDALAKLLEVPVTRFFLDPKASIFSEIRTRRPAALKLAFPRDRRDTNAPGAISSIRRAA